MSSTDFGFYFEKAGRGAAQGAIAPAEQFFEGSLAEESLARETGQNAIDAASGNGVVTLVYELATMAVDEVPGFAGLREHILAVEKQSRGKQGHDRMLRAAQMSDEQEIRVLRISDFGTKGLTGSESIDDMSSPLSALTRGAGISANDGNRGGSFGIGSAVGPMSSDLCTVLYTSMPEDSSQVVFAANARLATHWDSDGTLRVGDGFFTDLNHTADFRYLRSPEAVGPFPRREVPGTDIYVLAYRKADHDPTLEHIRLAFLNNFLMAIHRGDLIVRGIHEGGEWELNKVNLEDQVQSAPEAKAFYRALLDPEPISRETERFGQITLYINVDDTLPRSLHTITMRRPRMRIDTFRHTSIAAKYAAVLECADEKGNTLLRKLEPPQHHQWDPGRAYGGGVALRELKEFVREGLRSRVREELGDAVEIKGLERYLPSFSIESMTNENATEGVPTAGDGTEREASTVQGRPSEGRPADVRGGRSVHVKARSSADSDGDAPVAKGKDRGGKGTRSDSGGGLPGGGSPGSGSSRIGMGDIRFRSWTDSSNGDLCLALTSKSDIQGDLELVALGPGGSLESDFALPIETATTIVDGADHALAVDGNVLNNLHLEEGRTVQIRIRLTTGHRYRLGVK